MSSAADLSSALNSGGDADLNFDAPWQAQAFALVVRLSNSGYFGWDEWVRILSEEVAQAPALSMETPMDTYYRQWLSAVERIVITKGILGAEDAKERADQWRLAYLNTPHGQAVELAYAACPPVHMHSEASRGLPVAVSFATHGSNRQAGLTE